MKEILFRLLGIVILIIVCLVMVIFLWPLLAEGYNLITYKIATIIMTIIMILAIIKSK